MTPSFSILIWKHATASKYKKESIKQANLTQELGVGGVAVIKKKECSSYFIKLHLSSKDQIRSEGASNRIESKNSSQSVACSPVMKSFLALALVVLVAHNIVNIVRAGDADPLQDVCVADKTSGGM